VRLPLIALSLLASTCAALPIDLTGNASVIDGDTIEIHGTRIRLWGIDASESAQLCRNQDSDLYRCGAKAEPTDYVSISTIAGHRHSSAARPSAIRHHATR
jgi:hypothetical protein